MLNKSGYMELVRLVTRRISLLDKSWGSHNGLDGGMSGYSFPPPDIEMMYFPASALSENIGLRRIMVVDPKADTIISRLKSK